MLLTNKSIEEIQKLDAGKFFTKHNKQIMNIYSQYAAFEDDENDAISKTILYLLFGTDDEIPNINFDDILLELDDSLIDELDKMDFTNSLFDLIKIQNMLHLQMLENKIKATTDSNGNITYSLVQDQNIQ